MTKLSIGDKITIGSDSIKVLKILSWCATHSGSRLLIEDTDGGRWLICYTGPGEASGHRYVRPRRGGEGGERLPATVQTR